MHVGVGGHIGLVAMGVLVTLLLMSIASIGIMVERWWSFRQAARQSRLCAADVGRLLKLGKIPEAATVTNRPDLAQAHVARLLAAGLEEWRYQREARGADEESAAFAAREALRQAAALTLGEMRGGLSALATIGSTAPFVGLLGTTVGIIDAFAAMALTGSGGIGVISAGISEALITTAFGLFVAIPAVWAYNYFLGRIEGMSLELDRCGYQLVDHLSKRCQ